MKTDIERLQEYKPEILIMGVLYDGGLASVLVGSVMEYELQLQKFKTDAVRVFRLKESPVSAVNESFAKRKTL